MLEKKNCLVGNDRDDDRDDGVGVLIVLVIVFVLIGTILSIIFYVGAFIGGVYSIKNYYLAFKHNVIDSRAEPVVT